MYLFDTVYYPYKESPQFSVLSRREKYVIVKNFGVFIIPYVTKKNLVIHNRNAKKLLKPPLNFKVCTTDYCSKFYNNR